MNETILWEEELRGGQTWSQVLYPGMALRFTDLHGGANVSCLFYNAHEPTPSPSPPASVPTASPSVSRSSAPPLVIALY